MKKSNCNYVSIPELNVPTLGEVIFTEKKIDASQTVRYSLVSLGNNIIRQRKMNTLAKKHMHLACSATTTFGFM